MLLAAMMMLMGVERRRHKTIISSDDESNEVGNSCKMKDGEFHPAFVFVNANLCIVCKLKQREGDDDRLDDIGWMIDW